MVSSRSMPVGMRSSDALCSSWAEVTGQIEHPILLDEKRILVRAVDGAAVFHHPDAAGRRLIDHPVIE